MNSFHPSLSFHSIEAAVNGVARLARTQGFRIHQRKSPQKNNYELQGLASFGCTAPGCGWFINLKRVPIDGPSTSTAPAEQWIVYTLYDSHKSTCKPARSRRRRPSISSISSLETENTEDELPPELLRPYERSPSLPILMHARGSRPENADVTAPSQAPHSTPLAVVNGHADPPQSDAPDPVALSNYIQDLLASLEVQAPQPENTATSLDPRTFLNTLNDPLPMPPEFTFPPTEYLQSASTSSTPYPFYTQQPFSEALYNGQASQQELPGSLALDLDALPDRLHRAASMLQTIDPSQLHSPVKTNGYRETGPSMSAFFNHNENKQDSRTITNSQYQEYAAPIPVDDWSDSNDDNDSGEPDLSQSFLQHSYDGTQDMDHYNAEIWPENGNQSHYNGITHDEEEDEEEQIQERLSGEMSSSDSDIPAEALLNINTSRSKGSNSPDTGTGQYNLRKARQPSYDFNLDGPDLEQPDYAPYGPVQPLVHTAAPVNATAQRSARPPTFPTKMATRDEFEEHFDIYKIFHSFEEAEVAILANARKIGLPLKIRYRPNVLDSGPNARRQACLECLRLCGYRIYLKDDHRSQWRVINMEGGHKQSCNQGKAKTKTQRGTHAFRNYKNKDKDSMHVSIPVWEPPGGKRKRRASSLSTDRSSSPSILVVTHSDAVMKSVKTIGPGFTPPREYWYHSLSPEPVKKTKSKGKGKVKKNGHSPDKAIEVNGGVEEHHDAPYYGAGIEDDYLPPPLGNNFTHPDSRTIENDSPQADQYASKKLPTTQQLLHGSSRPGISARHKIPTKPLGRSPAKNRERRERRQANGIASGTYPRTSSANNDNLSLGTPNGSIHGESSANDDDEDMFFASDRFSQRTLSNGQSSRALRSKRRSNGTFRKHDELQTKRRSRREQSPDPSFMTLQSTASTLRKNGTHAAPLRGRGRPRVDSTKDGISKIINLKMSLLQAGFSGKQLHFLHKGGYSTVKDVSREGLACNVTDFSTFKSWLDDLTIPPEVMHDTPLTRQTIRARVKAIADEVRVRATIIWEAAGMMEEGSDVGDDGDTAADYNPTAPQDNGMHTEEEEEVRPPKRLRHAHIEQVPEQQTSSLGYQNRGYRSGSSSSSGIEFLGQKE